MKKMVKCLLTVLMLSLLVGALTLPAFAAEGETAVTAEESVTGDKALASGIAIGLAAGAGAIGMGIAIGKSVEGIARQPEAEGKIRTTLMLGLVFLETAIIYALLVVILIIFVL